VENSGLELFVAKSNHCSAVVSFAIFHWFTTTCPQSFDAPSTAPRICGALLFLAYSARALNVWTPTNPLRTTSDRSCTPTLREYPEIRPGRHRDDQLEESQVGP